MKPETERLGSEHFFTFHDFHYQSDTIQAALSPPPGRKWLSPAAELMKRQAQRSDIAFKDLIEADFLLFFASMVRDGGGWYPQLMHKKDRYVQFPLFIRAARVSDYKSTLAVVTGTSVEALADMKAKLTKRMEGRMFGEFWPDDLLRPMNLAALATRS